MTTTPVLRRWLFVLLTSTFVLAGLYNAIVKGGDFTVFLESGRRVLHGEGLYSDSRVAEGIVGPPFQAVFFVPFAWLAAFSEVASRLARYGLNLVALVAAVTWWSRALAPWADDGTTDGGGPTRWQRAWTTDVLIALLAVSHPLLANFQHQNLNVILLAAAGAAALASTAGRQRAAGVCVGVATALKAFPALLLAWFAVRCRVRSMVWGIATALALTAAPALWYGLAGWTSMVRDWSAISGAGGWPVRSHNQSLFAMVGRWLGPEGLTANGALRLEDDPFAYAVWAACVLVLCLGCGVLLRRREGARRSRQALAEEMAVVLGLAVLVSPIAWDHYWVLFFPAVLLARTIQRRVEDRRLSLTFWPVVVLISGPLLFPREVWRVYRWVSGKTLAGILLVIVLSAAIERARRASPRTS